MLVLTASVFALVSTQPALAADGDLDPTFDGDGKQTAGFGGVNSVAYAVSVQPDGKIVLAGYTGSGTWYTGTNRYLDLGVTQFAVARFNEDGSPDTSFGSQGKATTSFGAGRAAVATGVAIQPDRKILTAGYVYVSGLGNYVALARYNEDGTPDADFGESGAIAHAFVQQCPFDSRGYALLLQPDGRFILAGRGAPGGVYQLAFMRFNSDGSPDTSFGDSGTGLTLTPVQAGDGPVDAQLFSLARQEDGRLLAAGYAETMPGVSGSADFLLARYTSGGILDASFGAGGLVTTDLTPGGATTRNDKAYGVAVQADGRIVVAGFSGPNLALARYTSGGALDSTFGAGGIALTSLGSTGQSGQIQAVRVLADGRILAAGFATTSFSSNETSRTFFLARYLADGSLDTTYGGNGLARADFGVGQAEGFGLAFQSDHKAVIAGAANRSVNFAVARFLNSVAPVDLTAPPLIPRLFLPLLTRE